MAATTRSPGMALPSASTTPASVTSATPTPVSIATPWATSSAATSTASSGSSGVSTWSAASTTVVSMPRWARFSAVSSPTNPAPITTAVRGLPRAWSAKSSASSTVRRTRTRSNPGNGGLTGAAPGLRTKASYGSSQVAPSPAARTVTL